MKIRKEYVNKKVSVAGYTYDLAALPESKIDRLAQNPQFAHIFEEEIDIDKELKELGIDTPVEFSQAIRQTAKQYKKPKK